MEANIKTNWDRGMHYGFSEIRVLMSILGVWPFQRNELLCTIRWLIILIIEILAVFSLVGEYLKECGVPKDILETVLLTECCLHGCMSVIFPRLYMKRIANNINSAVDDWSTLETKPRAIMKGYARMGRAIVIIHIVLALFNFVTDITAVVLDEKQQVITVDNYNVTVWSYPMPASCLFGGVSYGIYNAFMVIQILQITIITLTECTSDTFFFCITMHLCGQLELLGNRFAEFSEIDNKKRHRNALRPLIRRHYELITLAKNIEDSFNINILMRIITMSVVIAMSGLRVISLVKQHKYDEAMRMIIFIQFYILQCFLFTHAGDTLHSQSAAIATAIYNTTWYELPTTTVKDLMLVMIRMKTPLRLSAGKFFYLKRTTITNILKTTMSYISFLQVTVKD